MDYINEYKKLKAKGFPASKETLDFVRELGRSDEIEAHFEIYCMEMRAPQEERGFGIYEAFSKHGKRGGEYLLTRLNDSDEVASHAAYLLSSFRVQSACQFNDKEISIILQVLSRLAESADCEIRRRCLIAVGWIGSENEFPLLNQHLLTDSDMLCRAWSASSFLQMATSKRLPCERLQAATKQSFIACLKSEKEIYVKGVATEAVQSIWQVNLGLRLAGIKNLNAVNRFANRALEFLEGLGC